MSATSTPLLYAVPKQPLSALAPVELEKFMVDPSASKGASAPAAVSNGHTSMGTRFLAGFITLILGFVLSLLILYLTRPPLVLCPRSRNLSNTRLYGWSFLFAFLVALIVMIAV